MKTQKPTIRGLYITGSIYLAGMLFVIVMGAHFLHLHLPQWFGWMGLGIFGNFIVAYPSGMIWHAFRSKQFDWEINNATQAYWVYATKIARAALSFPPDTPSTCLSATLRLLVCRQSQTRARQRRQEDIGLQPFGR